MSASYKKLRRCLVRHQYARTWFADGTWVPNPHQAQDFEDLGDILEACDIFDLKDVEIVFRGITEDFDVSVPLRSSDGKHLNEESSPSELQVPFQTSR